MNTRSGLPRFIVCLVTAALLVAAVSAQAPAPRVVAIADIHGDLDAFAGILQRARLIDANRRWTGGNATLVQTGDFIDRGPKSRAVMDFLMGLQKEAPRQQGRVVVLLGNHEVMNIIGDLRYVIAGDYASFADDRSERRRRSAYDAYVKLWRDAPPASLPASEAEWMAAHPPGFIEHRAAFGPDGAYGRWLRTLPAVAQINDSIFVHGGINPELAVVDVKKINEIVAAEIKFFDQYSKFMVDANLALPFATLDELARAAQRRLDQLQKEKKNEDLAPHEKFLGFGGWFSVHPDGPLWFRGYAEWSLEEGAALISRLTAAFKVARFVVGHTPQTGGIESRFDGKVYLIDTGMLSTYYAGGRASALEIQNGKLTPIYSEEPKR